MIFQNLRLLSKHVGPNKLIIIAVTSVAIVALESIGFAVLLPSLLTLTVGSTDSLLPNVMNDEMLTAVFLLIGVIFLKNVFCAAFLYLQNRALGALLEAVSKKLIVGLTTAEYYTKNETSYIESSRLINTEVRGAVLGYVLQTVQLMSELSQAAIFLSLTVFFYGINIILSVAVPLSFILIYIYLGRRKISELGRQRYLNDQERTQIAIISTRNKEEFFRTGVLSFFLKKFDFINADSNRIFWRTNFLQTLPKFALEAFAVLSILMLYLLEAENFSETLIVLGALVAKTLPGVARASVSYQAIKSGQAAVDRVLENLRSELIFNSSNNENLQISIKHDLVVNSVTDNHTGRQLSPNTITLKRGVLNVVMGDSGIGKTSLVKAILGYSNHFSYKIENGTGLNLPVLKVNYTQQEPIIFDGSLYENIAFQPDKFLLSDHHYQKLPFQEFRLDGSVNRRICEDGAPLLSGGQTQRVAILRALYHWGAINVFDEPTSALDENMEAKVIEQIRSKVSQYTITIIITHNTQLLTPSDNLVEITA